MKQVQIPDFANNAHNAYLGRVRKAEQTERNEANERRLTQQAVFFGVLLVGGMLIVGWAQGNL